ncbi:MULTISPECIES: glucose 1-dehydrogenase [Stappia]|uniref:3-oxoacyl-[acyl-carrier protein] reductase n=1 Tax=Stappia indica TaxID=538381 RepID=A0A285T2E5_9HYPH|nr:MULTISPECIES: glucose 1-dehydrogenase [Stappia]MBC2857502.1 glucose 1-dehydrogenase [Stappia sp. 28M-7]MCC4246556.1 glucose 1-dehydrogenase [Stappia indica]SOC13256.1 3-oxoacyl-[acyl-carrier protein] reductase [Stappia indica]
MKLKDKVAIVTGAGGGYGEGIAHYFAEQGAKVVVADIRGDAAEKVAGDIGASAVACTADVTSSESTKAMVQTALDAFGKLDILINNAGTTHKNQSMLLVDEATFDKVYAVNVKSIYHAAIHAVPVLEKNGGGVIINIASTAGVRPRPGLTWYNGSKGAAIAITRSMAVELADRKIRVCGINPVMGETGLTGQFLPGDDTPETRAKIIAGIPLGRMSRPLDIAKACGFLASDEAEFVTGVLLEVDGGRCI